MKRCQETKKVKVHFRSHIFGFDFSLNENNFEFSSHGTL